MTVRSDTGPFSLIPAWLLECHPSPRALYVYAVLARYADLEGRAFPSRRTLAARTGLGINTVDRAIDDLVELGALEVNARLSPDGDAMSNEYVVLRVRRGTPNFGETGAPKSVIGTRTTRNDGPSPTESPLPSVEESPSVQDVDAPPKRRDHVWDAFARCFGEPATKTERGERNRAVSEVKSALREAGVDITSEPDVWREVWLRHSEAVEHYPHHGPMALAKGWARLGKEATQPRRRR